MTSAPSFPASACAKAEQLVKRDMAADVLGAPRKAAVGMDPYGGVGAAVMPPSLSTRSR